MFHMGGRRFINYTLLTESSKQLRQVSQFIQSFSFSKPLLQVQNQLYFVRVLLRDV